ncbi:GGDEF domain-containing protein [Yoonia sp.]|uniref:GGDEF domain-containing protein n=1 Tax=Yoonia sp. TaxID=2212373 RepID=UPI003F4ADFB1
MKKILHHPYSPHLAMRVCILAEVVMIAAVAVIFIYALLFEGHQYFSRQTQLLAALFVMQIAYSPIIRKSRGWFFFNLSVFAYLVASFLNFSEQQITIAEYVDIYVFHEEIARCSPATRIAFLGLFGPTIVRFLSKKWSAIIVVFGTSPLVIAFATANLLSYRQYAGIIDPLFSPPTSLILVLCSLAVLAKASISNPIRQILYFRTTALMHGFCWLIIPIAPLISLFIVSYATENKPSQAFYYVATLEVYFFFVVIMTYNGYTSRLRMAAQTSLRLAERASYTDALSGALNRQGLDAQIERIGNKKFNSVLLLDIDNFKKINDSYGHFTGDRVIKKVSEFIQNNIRRDDICARWGGEEFIVILRNCTDKDARTVAEKIHTSLRKNDDKFLPRFTVSIGVGRRTTAGEDIYEIAKVADEFLYKAKRSGRDRIAYYNSIT